MERDNGSDPRDDSIVDSRSNSVQKQVESQEMGPRPKGRRASVRRPKPGSQPPGPKRTEDERMLDRQLPVEPVAKAAELGAFTHTDRGGCCGSRVSLSPGSMPWPRSARP